MNERERYAQIRLAAEGDADALQRLMLEYHGALRAGVERRINAKLRGRLDPDDVLQDAYLAAFRTAAGLAFDTPAAFYAWLERICFTRLVDHARAATRRKRNCGRIAVAADPKASSRYDVLAKTLVCPDSTPSRRAARNEAAGAVLTGLARLRDDQRDVIRLRFLESLSVAEVASRLGKTEDAVHGLCRRGLIALRESLGSLSRYLSRL